MNEQRIPHSGEWWQQKKSYQFRALILGVRPESLAVIYAWEEAPFAFWVREMPFNGFLETFEPVSPEDTNPRKDCSACAAILDMRRAAGPKPRFIRFIRPSGHPVYINLNEIEGVVPNAVYTRNGNAMYHEIKDAIETFEKAMREDP